MPEPVRLTKRPDGVAVLALDTPDSPVNVLSSRFFDAFRAALDAVRQDPEVRAAIFISAKPDGFVAGADLKELDHLDASGAERVSRDGHALFDRIAASDRPFVAAIHGAALGGGLELALACAGRVATDDPKTVLALPEVQLGLLPAAGGTQRLPRLIGLPAALPLLLTGQRLRARQAHEQGLVDALVAREGLEEAAASLALAIAAGKGPVRSLKGPLARLATLGPVRRVILDRARQEAKRKTGGHYPAPGAILDCVEAGLAHGVAAGNAAEERLFGQLVASDVARNLIGIFHGTNALKKVPSDPAPHEVRRLAVLGAGLMGQGIASVSVPRVPVVLKDVNPASLDRARSELAASLEKRVKSGSLTAEDRDRQIGHLTTTGEVGAIAGADLVVEAVFEDLALKRQVLSEVEAVLGPDAVFASNTSALPIGRIAEGAHHPERVVGMHYFSPVPKMPLLEVVAPEGAAPWAVATARAFGVAQGKAVLVVKDGPGFYTTRVLAPFLGEAVRLLQEGAAVDAVDRAVRAWGFPVGPFALLDEVGIDVGAHVARDLGAAFADRELGGGEAFQALIDAGVKGRKSGKGFYRYDAPGGKGGRARKGGKPVDESVYAFFGGPARQPVPAADAVDRLVLAFVNEAAHCLGEGVVASAEQADMGAILGLGFPPFRGGPFRYVDAAGAQSVVARLEELASRHGKRFRPAPILRDAARDGRRFR